MKRILFLWIVSMSLCLASAQDMKTVFVQMPDSIAPLLTKVNREDCVDFLASNMAAKVKNRFDKQAELKVLTDDYLQMQLTEVSTMEMKLLPLNDTVKIICMVHTYCASVCDSEVRFYTTDWKELKSTDYFQFPSNDSFILMGPQETTDDRLLRKKMDMGMYQLSLTPDEMALFVQYTTPQSLNEEDRLKLSPRLRKDPIKYVWEGGQFRIK